MLGLDSAIWFKLAQILILSVTALLVFLLVVKPMIRRLDDAQRVASARGWRRQTAIPAAQSAPAIAQAAGAQPSAPGQIGASPSPMRNAQDAKA